MRRSQFVANSFDHQRLPALQTLDSKVLLDELLALQIFAESCINIVLNARHLQSGQT